MTTPIKPRLTVIDGNVTTASLTLAEHFGMRHDNVLQTIDNTIRVNPEEFGRLNFQAVDYLDPKGERRRMYRLTKAALCFVVLGMTGSEAGRWKATYIDASGGTAGALGADSSDSGPLREPAPAAGDVVSARSSSETPARFGRLKFQESSPVSLLGRTAQRLQL